MSRINVDRRVLLAGVGGAVAGSFLAGTAKAGDLNPPPGPVMPTGRSLQQLEEKIARTSSGFAEPRLPVESLPGSSSALHVISASGSYYLTQNLLGEPGRHGIEILADDVDLHLGGFHLIGGSDPGSGLVSGSAIVTAARNVTVYDGTTIGWLRPVDFEAASMFLLWDVVSIGGLSGAFYLGSRGQAYDCDAYLTPGAAFAATGVGSLIEECGAWTCGTGFSCTGTGNLFHSNCATEVTVGFDIGQGNAHGPIVMLAGVGDISAVPGSGHPSANFVY